MPDAAPSSAADLAAVLRRPLAALPDPLPLSPPTRARGQAPIAVTVRPPGSKSLTNRALLLAALADGTSTLHAPLLDADDAQRMLAAIEQLGAQVQRPAASSDPLRITGVAGRWRIPPAGITINLNNAGTATRFLAASSLLAPAPLTIDGNERMRQRPIRELTDALAALGAHIEHLAAPGCPPVRVTAPPANIPSADSISLGTTQSSQFISGLLLTAPFLPGGLTLRLAGDITSRSYVEMTVGLLTRLGASVRTAQDFSIVRVAEGLPAFTLDIEPDASGATYFFAAGALLPDATVRVEGLPTADSSLGPSLQGDAHFPDLLAQLGCSVTDAGTRDRPLRAVRGTPALRPVIADLSDMPDAAMTLAVCCAFADGTSILRGVRTLRVKETDRIEALRTELAKIGVEVTPNLHGDPDALSITPPPARHGQPGVDCSPAAPPVHFETYDDHRMAMALALVALRRPNVFIHDPACVAKTYPTYWADFAKLYE